MTSYHLSRSEENPSADINGASQDGVITASPPNHAAKEKRTIIVQVASKQNTMNSAKVKSLLTKNLLSLVPKSDTDLASFQLHEPHTPIPSNSSIFSPSDLVVSQAINTRTSLNAPSMEFTAPLPKPDSIENILQQFQNSLVAVSVMDPEDSKLQSYTDQTMEPSLSLASEALQNNVEQLHNYVTVELAAKNVKHPNDTNNVMDSDFSTTQQILHEDEKEQEVVKKTMVEAFVKMVVCRKVTLQKVHIKTGQIMETKVKMEEEEPIILGVDCVETTEDLISSGADSGDNDRNTTEFAFSKWGASLDGGLKFLSAVSESRQKIGKSVTKDKLLKSTSKLLVSEHDKNMVNSKHHQKYILKASVSRNSSTDIKLENESDIEWNEEMNDDSEDYIPESSKTKSFASAEIQTSLDKKSTKHFLSSAGPANIKEEPCDISRNMNINSSPVVLFPRKRGRKRKWDNAIGIAQNLRTCQFCSKHFSSVQTCTKHMKKGKCVLSIFCLICSKSFKNEEELEVHIITHGNEAKSGVFECKDCNRAYKTRAGYAKHFRMGTCLKRDQFEDGYTGDFECDLCESRFSTLDYLRLHRYKVHENPKDTHNCRDCGKKFYSSQGYNKHRAGRPCTEPLRCQICGKTYSSKAKESFKIHMKHHRSEVTGITFHCDECGRSYMTQMALTKHKLSHTGVKPYKCDVCGKEFSMRYMVKDHARMHTGERPYLCSLCGSAFSNKGHLGRHLRSHENGTLMKRGRPKKIKEPEEHNAQETELKMIDLGQTLQNLEGQTIQVVDGQLFEAQTAGTPMIIQASNNTIIIAEGWSNANVGSAIALPCSQEIASNISSCAQ